MLGRTAPPTPAYHWTSASPLLQFHVQIRFHLHNKGAPAPHAYGASMPFRRSVKLPLLKIILPFAFLQSFDIKTDAKL